VTRDGLSHHATYRRFFFFSLRVGFIRYTAGRRNLSFHASQGTEFARLTNALMTTTILMSLCCGSAMSAAVPPLHDSKLETDESRDDWFTVAVLSCGILLLLAMVRGSSAPASDMASHDLAWHTDAVDFNFWETWQTRFNRSLLGSKVTSSLLPLMRRTHDPDHATPEEIRLSSQLFVLLDDVAKGGRMQMLVTKYRESQRGDMLWKDLHTYYEKEYATARTESHKSFFETPDGSMMDFLPWCNRLTKTIAACRGNDPHFTEFRILCNAFKLSSTRQVLTPSSVSGRVRLLVTTELKRVQDLPPDERATAEDKCTLDWLLELWSEDQRINPNPLPAVHRVDDSAGRDSQRICRYFNEGKACPYGDACRYPHRKGPTELWIGGRSRGRGRGRGHRGRGRGRGQRGAKKNSTATVDTSRIRRPWCPDFLDGNCSTSAKCPNGFRHKLGFSEQKLLAARYKEKRDSRRVHAVTDDQDSRDGMDLVAEAAPAPDTPPTRRRTNAGTAAFTRFLDGSSALSMVVTLSMACCMFGPAYSCDVAGDGPLVSRPAYVCAVEDSIQSVRDRDTQIMFSDGDIVFCKLTNRTATVLHVDGDDTLILQLHDGSVHYVSSHDVQRHSPEEPTPLDIPPPFHPEHEGLDKYMSVHTMLASSSPLAISVHSIPNVCEDPKAIQTLSEVFSPMMPLTKDDLVHVISEIEADPATEGEQRVSILGADERSSRVLTTDVHLCTTDDRSLVLSRDAKRRQPGGIMLQLDSGAFHTIVPSACYLHDANPISDWTIGDAGSKTHGHRHIVTHRGFLHVELPTVTNGTVTAVFPALCVPTITSALLNSTYLWATAGWKPRVDAVHGLTWVSPKGDAVKVAVKGGQEFVRGNIIYPVKGSVFAGADPVILHRKRDKPATTMTSPTDRRKKRDTHLKRTDLPPVPTAESSVTSEGARAAPAPTTAPPSTARSQLESSFRPSHTRLSGTFPKILRPYDSLEDALPAAAPTTPTSMPSAFVPGGPVFIPCTPDDRTPLRVSQERRDEISVQTTHVLLNWLRDQRIGRNDVDAIRIELAQRLVITTTSANDPYLRLHALLGHRSHVDTLALAAKLNLRIGKYAGIACDTCRRIKSKRQPVSRQAASRTKYNPLEAWNLDIWGPAQTRGMFNSTRYVLAAVDRATKLAITVHMSSLSQLALNEALEEFGVRARRLMAHAKQAKLNWTLGPRITTDSAAIFRSKTTRQVLTKMGFTVHYATPPYTQAKNGPCERLWGTIIPSARAMLAADNHGDGLLFEAISHATVIYNRIPHAALDGMSPMEALTGTQPDLSDIHRFGAPVWCHRHVRTKAQAKGFPAIYIGLDTLSNTHVVFAKNPNTGVASRLVAHHITFDTALPEAVLQGKVPALSDEESTSIVCELHRVDLLDGGDLRSDPSDDASFVHAVKDDTVYYSLAQAQKSVNGKHFTEAVLNEEIEGLRRMGALVPVRLEDLTEDERERTKRCQTLFYMKNDETGQKKPKCRLVFAGKSQVRGVDYDLRSSHMPRWATVRAHLGLQPSGDPRRHVLRHFDISKFFAHADNETVAGHRVVVRLPIHAQFYHDGELVTHCLVPKALYGQVNSAHLAEKKLFAFLRTSGWRQGYDPSSWIRDASRIICWCDDLPFRGPADEADRFYLELDKEFPGVKMRDCTFLLGHHVSLNEEGLISVSAEQYINEMVSKHGIGSTKETPLPPGCNPTKIDDAADPELLSLMRSLNGSLIHIQNTCRPDISFAASTLGQVTHRAAAKHVKLARHTLQYLKGTASKGIVYRRQPAELRNKLECYADASYADCAGFRSQTGFVIMLNGAPVSWSSTTQRFVTTSSQEAEIVAATDAVKECVFLKELFNSWDCEAWPCSVSTPITVHEDNEGAIKWFENGLMSNRAKHYGTRLYYVRDQITRHGTIRFRKIHTDLQIADALTKSLARAAQTRHTDKIVRPILHTHIATLIDDCYVPHTW